MSLLKVNDHQRLLWQHPRHQGHFLRGERGRDRHPDRRQRRRQIHHPEHHLRPAAAPHRLASTSRARTCSARARPQDRQPRAWPMCPEGRRVFLQMTVQENLEMGAYTQPQAARSPTASEQVYRAVSPPEGAPQAGGRHPVRRRAADAGHGPRPDEPSPSC